MAAKFEEDAKRGQEDGEEDVDAVYCALVCHFFFLATTTTKTTKRRRERSRVELNRREVVGGGGFWGGLYIEIRNTLINSSVASIQYNTTIN